jgi:glycosyltransferase involved in cell wall biosynthesis
MPPAPAVFLSYSGVLGGAERILLDGATRLGAPAALACPEGPLAAAARAAGLPVRALPERTLQLRSGPAAAAAHAAGLAGLAVDAARMGSRQARGPRPAALVAWGARAILACALVPRSRRPPLLAVHCDLPPAGAAGRALRAATRRADGVAALSHAIAAAIAPDAAVLHPGVDLEAWTPSPLPGGPPRALVLGALVAWKRADLALEIAARLPDLRLALAGEAIPGDDGAFLAGLQRRAAAADLRDRVRFLGRVDDPRDALAGAHLLLHCSDAEPYGLALVEALAAGRPVVAPASGGPAEIVADGAGRLYAPGDADAGAGMVRAVLADPGAPAAARARAEARFDLRRSSARLRAEIAALTSA